MQKFSDFLEGNGKFNVRGKVMMSAVENPMFGVEKTSCENGLK